MGNSSWAQIMDYIASNINTKYSKFKDMLQLKNTQSDKLPNQDTTQNYTEQTNTTGGNNPCR